MNMTSMVYNPKRDIANTKAAVLEALKDQLENIYEDDAKEIYFHDIITEIIDSSVPTNTLDAIQLAEYTGNEKYADDGILDKSSINRFAVTMAYECLYQEIFNDDFFQTLQEAMNNETIEYDKAQTLIHSINNELQKYKITTIERKEHNSQIYVTTEFDVSINDFQPPAFAENQVMNLSDNTIKIFTSNRVQNQNAIVLERMNARPRKPFRIYLMERSKDVDIREFFKYVPSIKENDYSLYPPDYVNGKDKRYFANKKEFIWFIHQMANALTDKSMEGDKQ